MNSWRSNRSITLALAIVLLFAWWYLKCFYIQQWEYSWDFNNSVQKSTSLIEGRSIFHYYNVGSDGYDHNYFLLLLVAPFVKYFGGIFLPALTMLLYAVLVARLYRAHYLRNCGMNSLILFGYLFSPIGFFIWDDIVFGWNCELLAAPLLSLLGVSFLSSGSRYERIFWSLLLLLVKEDAAIAVWAVWLLAFVRDNPTLSLQSLIKHSSVIRTTVLFGSCFILGLGLISCFGAAGAGRIGYALHMIPVFLSTSAGLERTLKLWLDIILFALVALWPIAMLSGRKKALVVLAVLIPLFVIAFVQGISYAQTDNLNNLFPVLWSPRVSFWWGIVSVAAILFLQDIELLRFKTMQISRKSLLLVLVILGQIVFLQKRFPYVFIERFFPTVSAHYPASIRARFSAIEQSFIECLVLRISPEKLTAVDPAFHMPFLNHRTVSSDSFFIFKANPDYFLLDSAQRGLYQQSTSGIDKRLQEQGFLNFDCDQIRFYQGQNQSINAWTECCKRH